MKQYLLLIALAVSCLWTPVHAKTTLDVLILYVPEVTKTTEGKDIRARAASLVEYANQSLRNSKVNAEFRLVGLKKWDAPFRGISSSSLAKLRADKTVRGYRTETGADFTVLLTPKSGSSCGTGYVSGGSKGKFYSSAPYYAFSISAVNCGLSTFVHELGHNMGLNHSAKQSGVSNVLHKYGRGYGVSDRFATVMAYPSRYSTSNHIAMFSNPASSSLCKNLACGKDRYRSDGADAAQALRNNLTQLANFNKTKVNTSTPKPVVTKPASTGISTSTKTTTIYKKPTSKPSSDSKTSSNTTIAKAKSTNNCSTPTVSGNKISNASFSSTSGWRSINNKANMATRMIEGNDCRNSVLQVKNRISYASGALTKINGSIERNQTYELKAKVALYGTTKRQSIKFVLVKELTTGKTTHYLDPISVTANEFSLYSEQFKISDTDKLKSLSLTIYGPEAGIDFLVDDISFKRK